MKPNSAALLLQLSVAMLACAFSSDCAAQQGSSAIESDLLERTQDVRLGDSAAEVGRKLKPFWLPTQTNHFLTQYPFTRLVPYTNSAVIREWQSKDVIASGWPMLVFAVFSSPAKTNLVDALLFSGHGVQPLVDGLYQRNLLGIRRGDSVEKVYALLGRKECEYFRAEDGKWHVTLTYFGCHGEFIDIEVDAGTGVVLKTADMTI